MVYQFKLQVPVSRELNKRLKKRAKEVGFSSVSDVARLLLTQFAQGDLVVSFMNSSLVNKNALEENGDSELSADEE